MEHMVISRKMFKSLTEYDTKDIIHTEAKIFILPDKDKWNRNQKVLKFLYNDTPYNISNKEYTIEELDKIKNDVNIEEIIFPEKKVYCDKKFIGFTMPLINGTNFLNILDSDNYSNKFKKEKLIEIGEILKKMEIAREYLDTSNFFVNDLHEANFILNYETNKMNIVDTDSFKVSDNGVYASKYLSPYGQIQYFPKKYVVNPKELDPGYIIPSQNTDYYCYTLMVLNFLYQGNIKNLSINDFFIYLDFLSSLGYDVELLHALSLIYTYQDNINVGPYLESLPVDYKTAFLSSKMNFKKNHKLTK